MPNPISNDGYGSKTLLEISSSSEHLTRLSSERVVGVARLRWRRAFCMDIKIQPTTKIKRSLHLLIDNILLFGIAYSLYNNKLIPESIISILSLVCFLNWFVLEPISGKTIGKFITHTKTVASSGKRLSFGRGILKAFVRLIPFDQFSFFFSSHPVGWHDKLSGTIVVDDELLKQFTPTGREYSQSKSVHQSLENNKKWKIKPLYLLFCIACLVVVAYFVILIIKEVKSKDIAEKQMECLKLDSDFARRRCLLIIESKKISLYDEYLKSKPKKDCGIYCDLIPSSPQDEFNQKMDEVQNSVQEAVSKEMEKQANCERLGGRYQGGGTCVYY